MVQSGGGIGRRASTTWGGNDLRFNNGYRVGSNPTLTTKVPQLIRLEQLTHNQQVVGSIPTGTT